MSRWPGSLAAAQGLANVEVINADARRTGLTAGAFDLVHTRTLLVTLPQPEAVVAEMVRLARPGGWVACQEPDVGCSLCYPQLPEWDRCSACSERASFAPGLIAWSAAG